MRSVKVPSVPARHETNSEELWPSNLCGTIKRTEAEHFGVNFRWPFENRNAAKKRILINEGGHKNADPKCNFFVNQTWRYFAAGGDGG